MKVISFVFVVVFLGLKLDRKGGKMGAIARIWGAHRLYLSDPIVLVAGQLFGRLKAVI